MRRRNLWLTLLFLVAACVAVSLLVGGPGENGGAPPEPGAAPGAGVPGAEATAGGTASAEEAAPGEAGGSGESAGGPDGAEGGAAPSLDTESAWSVVVRVRGPDGEPADGIARILDPGTAWSYGELARRGRGEFAGYLPAPGTYFAEGEVEGTRMRAPFEVGDEAPAAEVEISFAGSATVSGAVYGSGGAVEDGVKGEERVLGQADLAVELIPEPRPGEEVQPLLSSLVDAGGSYRIVGVPPGKYLLRVGQKFHVERIEVGEGEHVVRDLRLGGGRIRGRVTVRETGEPATRVQVVVQIVIAADARGEILRRAGFDSVADRLVPREDGTYEFANLPSGEYRLFCNGLEYAPARGAATIDATGPAARVDFVLERGAKIDISVLDLEGSPVETPFWTIGGIRCGFTGTVSGIPAGKRDFIAFAVGHVAELRRVSLPAGETTPLEFRLAPDAPTRLRFSDPTGVPVAGVRVSVPWEGRDLQPVMASLLREKNLPFRTTGEDGVVWIRGAAAGPLRVVAKRSGFALHDAPVELPPGGGEVRVALEPAGTTFTFRVRVVAVGRESPARSLGIEPGDVILSYDGVPIDSLAALTRAIATAVDRDADAAEIVLARDGERRTLNAPTGVLGVRLEEFEESPR